MSTTVPDPSSTTASHLVAPRPLEERFHELKFVLDPEPAARVEAWAAGAFGAASRRVCATTFLFLDTAGLDVARRIGDLRRERFRVRREGESPSVLLERKTKRGDETRLRSTVVDVRDLPRLATPDLEPDWPGRRFHRHVVEHDLRPTCCVTFERVAFGAADGDGPVRVTLDREIRGEMGAGWAPRPIPSGADLLEGRVLVEVRFPEVLPAAVRALVAEMRLAPASFSKYRRALVAAGALERDRP